MLNLILFVALSWGQEPKRYSTSKTGLYTCGANESAARAMMAELSTHIFNTTGLNVGTRPDPIAGLTIDAKGVELSERPERPLTKVERDAILAAIVTYVGTK